MAIDDRPVRLQGPCLVLDDIGPSVTRNRFPTVTDVLHNAMRRSGVGDLRRASASSIPELWSDP